MGLVRRGRVLAVTAATVPALAASVASAPAKPAPEPGRANVVADGGFADGLDGWSRGAPSHGSWPGYPKVDTTVDANGCLPDKAHDPFLQIDVPEGAAGYAQQSFTVPLHPSRLTFGEWGNLQPVTARVSVITSDGVSHTLTVGEPPRLQQTPTSCSGRRPLHRSYDLSAYAGERVTLRFQASSDGDDGTIADFDDVRLTSVASGTLHVRYVALGDSYSSGESVAPYEEGSDDKHVPDYCHRSPRAYSELLADRDPGVPGVRITDLRFYACSGATIDSNLIDGSRYSEPAQLSHRAALRRARLVTLSIGGNDARFTPVLTKCLEARCYRGRFAASEISLIDGLQPQLIAAFGRVKRAAPNAHVVVLDYPNPFPKGHVSNGSLVNCAFLLDDFNANALAKVAWLHDRADQLDEVLRRAAAQARVQFVDVRPAFRGHGECSSDPWVHKLVFTLRGNNRQLGVIGPGSFHPDADGQAADARALAAALRPVFDN